MLRCASLGGLSDWTTILGAVLFSLFAFACGSQFEAPLPPRDTVHYPIGLEMHPNGRFLYVVNSNFNARYLPEAGGTVAVVDTHSLEIRDESTPFIPSFGGGIELNSDATRAYVPAREGNSLVSLRVSERSGTAPAGGALYCLDDEGEPTSDPANCVMQEIPTHDSEARLATDPFALSVTTLRRTEPDSGREIPVDVVGLSYLGSNQVSSISIPDRSLANASLQSASVVAGGNAIARRPGTLNYYVAGRSSNVVARFSPFLNFRETSNFGEVQALFKQGELTLNRSRSRSGTITVDARGVAFDESGDRLYTVTRRPDALYIFDLVPSNRRTASGLDHKLTATVPLSNNPSDVIVHRTPEGRRLLYVPSYEDEAIDVVDVEARTLVDQIELDASPYDMVVDTSPNRCGAPGETCRAYVSLFQDTRKRSGTCGPEASRCGSVAVIDLDPASSRYHGVIRKIR